MVVLSKLSPPAKLALTWRATHIDVDTGVVQRVQVALSRRHVLSVTTTHFIVSLSSGVISESLSLITRPFSSALSPGPLVPTSTNGPAHQELTLTFTAGSFLPRAS